MSELQELYQSLIIDHGRNPRHFGKLPTANQVAQGVNPLCGDQLTLYLEIDPPTQIVKQIQFTGVGCAISVASASLMAEQLQGKTVAAAHEIFKHFRQHLTQEADPMQDLKNSNLGKLQVFSGVREFPSRVKCATLAWHTLHDALNQSRHTTTTE